MQTALTAITALSGNVLVAAAANGYTVTFQGGLAHQAVATLGIDGTKLQGAPAVKIAKTGAQAQVTVVAQGGGFTLTLNGQTTATLPATATAAEMQAAIRALGASFANVTVTQAPLLQTITLQAGPFVQVQGTNLTLSITIAGQTQTLSGNFAFEQKTNTAGESIIRVAVTDVTLSINAGPDLGVSLTNGQGFFILSPAGLAGELSASVALQLPPAIANSFHFEGTFAWRSIRRVPKSISR